MTDPCQNIIRAEMGCVVCDVFHVLINPMVYDDHSSGNNDVSTALTAHNLKKPLQYFVSVYCPAMEHP